jgi:hypothetical protein
MALRVGDYVKHTSQPEWGIGRVISIGEREKISIFFLHAGKRTFQGTSLDIRHVDVRDPLLELAGTVDWGRADRNLYVVELNPKVFDWERRFFEANLHWIPGNPCVYVGLSGLTPEERFWAHQRGKNTARVVQEYGRRLLPDLSTFQSVIL